jgi:hypothetical protein
MGHRMSARRLRTPGASLLAVGLISLATASFAGAADTIYWGDFGTGNLAFANLAGGGGGYFDVTGGSANEINGVAIDSAAGKIQGAATITIEVACAGTATLSGKRVARQSRKRSAASAGKVKLLAKAKGNAKKTLAKKGKVKIKATVGFAPPGGSAACRR